MKSTFETTWMNLEGIMLSEINQTKKDKYYTISLVYRIQRTMNKQNRNRLIDAENKLLVARGEGS